MGTTCMRLALVNEMRQESPQLYEYTLCPARCSNEQYYQKLHIHNNHFHPLLGGEKKKIMLRLLIRYICEGFEQPTLNTVCESHAYWRHKISYGT